MRQYLIKYTIEAQKSIYQRNQYTKHEELKIVNSLEELESLQFDDIIAIYELGEALELEKITETVVERTKQVNINGLKLKSRKQRHVDRFIEV